MRKVFSCLIMRTSWKKCSWIRINFRINMNWILSTALFLSLWFFLNLNPFLSPQFLFGFPKLSLVSLISILECRLFFYIFLEHFYFTSNFTLDKPTRWICSSSSSHSWISYLSHSSTSSWSRSKPSNFYSWWWYLETNSSASSST